MDDPCLREGCARYAGRIGTLAELVDLPEAQRDAWASCLQLKWIDSREDFVLVLDTRLDALRSEVMQFKEIEDVDSTASTYSDYSDSSSVSSD